MFQKAAQMHGHGSWGAAADKMWPGTNSAPTVCMCVCVRVSTHTVIIQRSSLASQSGSTMQINDAMRPHVIASTIQKVK